MVKIERIKSRPGSVEVPWPDANKSFQLASPDLPTKLRNLVAHSTPAKTIEEAADLVDRKYALRMFAPGKRPSLISYRSLRVTR